MKAAFRKVLLGASLAVAAALAACSNPELADNSTVAPPSEAPPPAAPTQLNLPPPEGRVETTELLGGPATVEASTPAPPPPVIIASTPVPNPEDLSPEDRARIYGPASSSGGSSVVLAGGPVSSAYQPPAVRHGRHWRHRAAAPARSHLRRHRTGASALAAPVQIAKPRPVKPLNHHAPSLAAAAPPPRIPAVKAPATPRPAKPAPAPKVAAAKPAPASSEQGAPQDINIAKLGAALNASLVNGAKLDVPAGMAAGKSGVVTLTLPLGLSDQLASEAGKLDLTREALSVDIRTSLSGSGYTILPNGDQTARLKPGEAATFNWQVSGGPDATGPLMALVGGVLKGGREDHGFVIGEVVGAAPAPSTSAPDAAAPKKAGPPLSVSGVVDKLAVPGAPMVDIPGIGFIRSGYVVLAGLGLFVLVLLIALASRAGSDRRAAERRRKFRTMTDFTGEGANHHGAPDDENHALHSRPLETV